MTARDVLDEACRQVSEIMAGAARADLGRPTPCDNDLRALVNHFAGTTGAIARVGAREPLDPDDPWGSATEVTEGDWPTIISERLRVLSTTWSRPEAWEGMVIASGPPMPASSIGDMALIEVVLHGWDLAQALDQGLQVSPAVAAEVLRAVTETAELGRRMGAYGPEVEVPADAPDLERALGVAGRDPRWRG